uniref:Uncharacterized protein n=1 Tax=viral metagenome TaxID=1070528 RepID=A0A6C0AF09_9ZZZZ
MLKKIISFNTALENSNKYDYEFQSTLFFKDGLKKFFENNEDINMTHLKNKSTALQIACSYGDFESFKLIMEKNPDINYLNLDNCTSLEYACYYNNYDIVKILIENKANINPNKMSDFLNSNKMPGFFAALIQSHEDRTDEYNDNMYFNNKLKILKLLINNGLDINYIDNEGNTLLHVLINTYYFTYSKNNILKIIHNIVLLFLENNNFNSINIQNDKGSTILHYSIKYSDKTLFNMLIKHGASLKLKIGKSETTFLQYSSYFNKDIDILKLMIKNEQDVFEKNKDQTCLVGFCCIVGNYEYLEYLSELIEGYKYDPFSEKIKKKTKNKKLKELYKISEIYEDILMKAYLEVLDSGDYYWDGPVRLKDIRCDINDNLILATVKNHKTLELNTIKKIIDLLLFYEVDLNFEDCNKIAQEEGNIELENYLKSIK